MRSLASGVIGVGTSSSHSKAQSSDDTGVGHNLTAKPNPLALMEGEEDLEKTGHMVWCGDAAASKLKDSYASTLSRSQPAWEGFLHLHFTRFSACVEKIPAPPHFAPVFSLCGKAHQGRRWCSTGEDALPGEMWQGGMSIADT